MSPTHPVSQGVTCVLHPRVIIHVSCAENPPNCLRVQPEQKLKVVLLSGLQIRLSHLLAPALFYFASLIGTDLEMEEAGGPLD